MQKNQLKIIKDTDVEIGEALIPQLAIEKFTKFLRWSGRYEYSSGKTSYAKGIELIKKEYSRRAIALNPVYQLQEPLLWQAEMPTILQKTLTTIKLHIDIDGTNPLDVVSGTVNRWSIYMFNAASGHFIGRVTANTAIAGGRQLVVEDFSFTWPQTTKTIDRLEITLTDIFNPRASATFFCTAENKTYGPYTIPKVSGYFREVEFEIDREDDARTVEPYNTHTHPDRPADLPNQNLTIKKAYARAGIRVDYSDEANIIETTGAGEGGWSNDELHQAMEDHWSAFANEPQWKLWVFLGEHHANAGYAGIMFDSETPEAGDVTRQGTAVFTEADWLFGATGSFASDNSNPADAVERELFFTTVHEIGHAFNLAHSWQKTLAAPYGFPWTPPDWAPAMTDNDQGLSWMNYPWRADTDPVDTYCAKWFYDRFYFRFEDGENLFLRHAPERYVQMGNETWFENHGLADESRINRALSLQIRSRRDALELGEPVFVELRLQNRSKKAVQTHGLLDPASGFVQIAVTAPDGKKLPVLPPIHVDQRCAPVTLNPGASLYQSVQLTAGKMGFHFKKPGAYRIEACYTSQDGTQASAVMQLWVKPASFNDERTVSALFDGRVARVLYFGGARTMNDVTDKLEWVIAKLPAQHPAKTYLASCLAMPFAKEWKSIAPGAKKVKLLEADHERAERTLAPAVKNLELFTDTLGHIKAREVADAYVNSALKVRKAAVAITVKKELLALFKKRSVIEPVIKQMEAELKRLK